MNNSIEHLVIKCGMLDFARAGMEQVKDQFFNLPGGWMVAYYDHYQWPAFGIFEAGKAKGKKSIHVEVRAHQVKLVSLGNYSSVDWYILKQRFGGVAK